jgi:hypothetical protein
MNPRRLLLAAFCLPVALLLACSSSDEPDPTPVIENTATAVPPTATATVVPTATPVPIIRQDILASQLTIPSLGIDSRVQLAQEVPYIDSPLPGCPGDDSETTLTVPNSGVATPDKLVEGLENKAWILGHSRFAGVAQTFFALQDINLGDEVIVSGKDRETGAAVEGKRFIVDGIYLTDTDSGEEILNNDTGVIPPKPLVVLQTSVREDGAGKQWILDRAKLTAKAKTVIEGDINDPCKYLLLFVTATAA